MTKPIKFMRMQTRRTQAERNELSFRDNEGGRARIE